MTRTITIADTCPQCGGRRGQPQGMNQAEDGAYWWVQVWENPCGHKDLYTDVITEAIRLAAGNVKAGHRYKYQGAVTAFMLQVLSVDGEHARMIREDTGEEVTDTTVELIRTCQPLDDAPALGPARSH